MMKIKITKKDILLVFIAIQTEKAQNLISSIQIMKGMFLISKELKIPRFYEFKPYLYGPCSFEVYSDLISLLESNLIDTVVTQFSWKYYKVTNVGTEKSNFIIKSMDKELLNKLKEIKEFVINKNYL